MISIKRSKIEGSVKIPLSFDIELECQILDTAQMFLARSRTRTILRDSGTTTDGLDTSEFLAMFDAELILQMAMISVKSWTGVEEPCTPQNVRELLAQAPWGQEFERMYNHVSWEDTARKNGFAPWQNGNSLAGLNTAEAAETPICPAQEASAETTAISAPM